MGAGYFSYEISKLVEFSGKVVVICPKKPKGGDLIPLDPPKAERCKNRTVVERANARIKDDLAGSGFRFRTFTKVSTHLGISILALAAEQIARHLL